MINFTTISGFDSDQGNSKKNEKQGVSVAETEQVFFNFPILLSEDEIHSKLEQRYHALGRTDEGRLLHIPVAFQKPYL